MCIRDRGIAMVTSIVSSITNIPVNRDLAMTGEVTITGQVLPIGGLKEKLLAAKRGFISTVIIPEKNRKDLSEIPEEIQNGLKIIPVNAVEDVLNISLERFPSPVIDPLSEDDEGSDKESPKAPILPETESSDSPRTYDA